MPLAKTSLVNYFPLKGPVETDRLGQEAAKKFWMRGSAAMLRAEITLSTLGWKGLQSFLLESHNKSRLAEFHATPPQSTLEGSVKNAERIPNWDDSLCCAPGKNNYVMLSIQGTSLLPSPRLV